MDAPRPTTADAGDPAPLTAALIRRGANPWWGKDQPRRASAVPAPAAAAMPEASGAKNRAKDGAKARDPGRFSFLDRGLWRDVSVFLAVFAAALAAMLYVALRAS